MLDVLNMHVLKGIRECTNQKVIGHIAHVRRVGAVCIAEVCKVGIARVVFAEDDVWVALAQARRVGGVVEQLDKSWTVGSALCSIGHHLVDALNGCRCRERRTIEGLHESTVGDTTVRADCAWNGEVPAGLEKDGGEDDASVDFGGFGGSYDGVVDVCVFSLGVGLEVESILQAVIPHGAKIDPGAECRKVGCRAGIAGVV